MANAAVEAEPSSLPFTNIYGEPRPPTERQTTHNQLRKSHIEKIGAPLTEQDVVVYKVEATRMDFWKNGFWDASDLKDITEFIFEGQATRAPDPAPLTIRIENNMEEIINSKGASIALNLGLEDGNLWGIEADVPMRTKEKDPEPLRWVRGIVGQNTEDLASKDQVGDQFHSGHIEHKLDIAQKLQRVIAEAIKDQEPVHDSRKQFGPELKWDYEEEGQEQEEQQEPQSNIVVLSERHKTA